MLLAIVYFTLPKLIATNSKAFDIRNSKHLINCILIYHLFSTLVAGLDGYPLWLRRRRYLATGFRICNGLYITLGCCLGGHRWILIALAGCLFNYLDGYWRCCRENNGLITDASPTGTDAPSALHESAKSASGRNNELVTHSSSTDTDAHNVPRASAMSAYGEDDELLPDVLRPGTDAYNVLYESVKSACVEDSGWIIDTHKVGLASVQSHYQKLIEELQQFSVEYIKGRYYFPKPPFRCEASSPWPGTALDSQDIENICWYHITNKCFHDCSTMVESSAFIFHPGMKGFKDSAVWDTVLQMESNR